MQLVIKSLMFVVFLGIFVFPLQVFGSDSVQEGMGNASGNGSVQQGGPDFDSGDEKSDKLDQDGELDREALYEKLRKQDQGRRKLIADPLEPVNRAVFKFNDKVYVYVFTPVSDTYTVIVPHGLRDKIGNIFYNLGYPQRFVNDLLQLRFAAAAKETGSFLVNTCLGFLGYLDVAQHIESLNNPAPPDNDFGVTLRYWGMGQGFYIVWPVMGPSTLRVSTGMVGDYFVEYYSDPFTYYSSWELSWGLRVEERLNSVPTILNRYNNMKGAALSPYTAVKNGYVQYRQNKLRK